jgi:hypothetical protein
MTIRRLLCSTAAAAALLGAACGDSGSSGSVTFTGTVRSQTFAPKEAISTQATITTSSGQAQVAAIIFDNKGGVCTLAASNKEPGSSQYLVLALGNLNIDSSGNVTITAPTAAGDYSVWSQASGTVPAAHLALVFAQTTDAQCKDVASGDAGGINGTVHLTGVNSGAYTGTFDINTAQQDASGNAVGTPEHATGSFSSTACASLGAYVSTQRNTVCQ